jgi:hypothetical protein
VFGIQKKKIYIKMPRKTGWDGSEILVYKVAFFFYLYIFFFKKKKEGFFVIDLALVFNNLDFILSSPRERK